MSGRRERFAEIPEQARVYFEPQLDLMNLSDERLRRQDPDDYETLLTTVTDAIDRAGSFPPLRIKITPTGEAVITQSKDEANFEIGILPILLERKALILRGIAAHRCEQGLSEGRNGVESSVTDPTEQEALNKADRGARTVHSRGIWEPHR